MYLSDELKIQVGLDIDASLESIKSDLDKKIKPALKDYLKLDVSIDTTKLKTIEKQLTDLRDILGKVDTVKLADFSGADVSTKKISAATAEKLKQTLAIKEAEAAEKLRGQTEQNNAKIDIQNSKLRIQLKKEESLAIKAAQAEALKSTSNQDSIEKSQQDLTNMALRMDRMKVTWSSFVSDPELAGKWDTLKDKIAAAFNEKDPEKMRAQITLLNKEVSGLSSEINIAGKAQQSFSDSIENTGRRLAAYMTSMLSYTLVLGALKSGLKAVQDTDNAMAELKMVTNATSSSYDNFLKNATEGATRLGTSIDELINSTTSFVRLGYSFDDASKLGEYASILSTVGQMSLDDATSAMVSQMKAFGVATEDALGIIDLLTVSDSQFSVTAAGVATALQRSSAALAAANNTMEESVALVNAVNAVLQDPEKSGTVLTRIASRLRNTTGELAEMGLETDNTFESVTQLQQKLYELTNNKVDIMIDSSTFKSTYQILQELSAEWKNLTDVQQASISRIVSGIAGAQGFSALMTNFKDAEDSIVAFESASGDALEKNAKMMDSTSKKTEQFKAQFQAMAISVVDSGLIKGFLDIGTAILKVFSLSDSLLGKLVLYPTALVAISTALKTLSEFSFVQNLKGITDIPKNAAVFTEYGQSINAIKQAGDGAITSLQGIFMATNGLSDAQTKAFLIQNQLRLGSQALTEAQLIELLQTQGMTAVKAQETAAEILNTTAKGTSTAASTAQIGVNTGLLASIKAVTTGLLAQAAAWLATPMGTITAVAVSIYAIVTAVNYASKSYERQKEKLTELSNEYQQLTSDLKTAEEKLVDIAKQIDEINNKGTPSITDQSDLDRLQQENRELENQIALLKMRSEAANVEQNLEAIKSAKSFSKLYMEETPGPDGIVYDSFFDIYLDKYSKLISERDELNKKIDDGVALEEKELQRVSELPDEIIMALDPLAAIAEEASNIASNITGSDDASIQWKNTLLDIADYIVTINKTPIDIKAENLEKLLSGDTYSDVINKLKEYGQKGELTPEVVQSYSDFNDALGEIGVTAEELVAEINHIPKDTFTQTAQTASELTESIQSLSKSYSTLESAQKEMADGGLSLSTVTSLMEELTKAGEDYLDYLYVENGQVKLNTKAYEEYAKTVIKSNLEILKSDKSALESDSSDLKAQKERLESLKSQAEDFISNIDFKIQIGLEISESDLVAADEAKVAIEEYDASLDDIDSQLAVTEKSIDSLTTEINIHEVALKSASDATISYAEAIEILNSRSEDVKSQFDSMTSEVKTLNSAISKLNEGTALSGEEILSLIQKYPQLLSELTKTENGYKLTVSSLELARNASINEARDSMNAQINKAKSIIQTSKTVTQAIANEITAINSLASASAALAGYTSSSKGLMGLDYTLFDFTKGTESYAGTSIAYMSDTAIANLQEKVFNAQNLANIQAMYASLEMLDNLDWSEFGVDGASGGSTDALLEAYNALYDTLQHLRAMDAINDQEYYDRLQALDKKYFEGKSKYISEHRKVLEELYSLQKEISDNRISDLNAELTLLEYQNTKLTEQLRAVHNVEGGTATRDFYTFSSGNYDQQIAKLKEIQAEVHKLAEARREYLRALGYAEEEVELDSHIQGYKSDWWEAEASITSKTREQIDARLEASERYIEERNRYNDWLEDSEEQAYERILAYLKEYHAKGSLSDKEYYELRMKYLYLYEDAVIASQNKLAEEELATQQELVDAYNAATRVAVAAIEKQIDAIEDLNDALQDEIDLLEKQKSNWVSAINYATTVIDEQIEGVEELNDALKDQLDLLTEQESSWVSSINYATNIIDDQIEALEAQKKALKDANDEKDRAIELEKLEQALADAQKNKIKRIYREDVGFVFEEDTKAIEDAQKALDDFNTETQILEIEKLIEAWEQEKKAWTSVVSNYEAEQDKLTALQMFGYDIYSDILAMKSSDLASFVADEYASIKAQITNTNTAIGLNEDIIASWEEEKKAWTSVVNNYEKEQDRLIALQMFGYDIYNDILDKKSVDLANYVADEYASVIAQIENKNAELAINQEKIASWQELKNEWSSVASNYESEQDRINVALQFGSDFEELVLDGRLSYLKKFVKKYNAEMEKLAILDEDTGEITYRSVTIDNDSGGVSFDANVDYQALINEAVEAGASRSVLAALEKARNAKIDALGLSYAKTYNYYAKGVKRAPNIDAIVDEYDKKELILRGGRYTRLEYGDGVLPANLTENLFTLAQNPLKVFSDALTNIQLPNINTQQLQPITISIGDIHLSDVQDVNGLSNAIVNKLPNMLIQKIYK